MNELELGLLSTTTNLTKLAAKVIPIDGEAQEQLIAALNGIPKDSKIVPVTFI
jgi:hypothetical protein